MKHIYWRFTNIYQNIYIYIYIFIFINSAVKWFIIKTHFIIFQLKNFFWTWLNLGNEFTMGKSFVCYMIRVNVPCCVYSKYGGRQAGRFWRLTVGSIYIYIFPLPRTADGIDPAVKPQRAFNFENGRYLTFGLLCTLNCVYINFLFKFTLSIVVPVL